jgi:hypothetical protein
MADVFSMDGEASTVFSKILAVLLGKSVKPGVAFKLYCAVVATIGVHFA